MKKSSTPADTSRQPDTADPARTDKSAARGDPREALKRSEKRAAEEQPGSFRDRENEEKIVEIGGDRTDDPIKGLDPDPKR